MNSQDSIQRSSRSSSATDSSTSRAQQLDNSNMIKACLVRSFNYQTANDSFPKFQEILDYMGTDTQQKLYTSYNTQLLEQVREATDILISKQPVDGYSCEQHIQRKIQYYAFRFMNNVGKYLIDRRKFSIERSISAEFFATNGNGSCQNDDAERAKKYFISLAKILLKHSLLAKSDSANLALLELQQLCEYSKTTLQELYYNNQYKFLKSIIIAILEKLKGANASGSNDSSINGNELNNSNLNISNNSIGKKNCVASYMTRALDVFSVSTIKRDEVTLALKIITILAHKEIYDEPIKLFLDYLACYQGIDKWSFLNKHIQPIIVGLMLDKKFSVHDVGLALQKLAHFCEKEDQELFQRKISFIKAELLMHYSKQTDDVTQAICYLSRYEKNNYQQPFGGELEDNKKFISYLYPDMIGILLGVDFYMTSPNKKSSSQEVTENVRSLHKLLTLLTPVQVQSIHHKLLSTLMILLNLRADRNDSVLNFALKDIWEIFVVKLNEDSKISLIIQICIQLKELLEDCPAVASIYEIFFELPIETIKDKLKYLFFIPNIPTMRRIYELLTPYVKRDDTLRNMQQLQESLDCVFALMRMENLKSRLIGLSKLKSIIKVNQHFLINTMLVNPDEPLNHLISKTIELLISLSSTQDEDCSNLIAECLGLLGAVNPIRLDHLIYGDLSAPRVGPMSSLLSDNFRVELIERLKVSLFSDRINESESANYALQVIMKYSSRFTENIKPKLSEDALRACSLCQNTLYGGYRKPPSDSSTAVYEKLKTEGTHSYRDWLEKFSWNLISTIGIHVEQEILEACSYVFKYNSKFAEYLLPHAITYIITDQPKQIDIIKREVDSILNEDVGVSTQDLDDVRSDDIRGNIQTLHLQCANMIFCCLDACYKLQSDLISSGLLADKAKIQLLNNFNSSIPKDKLALLASKCRTHARTLYYFDQHLFEHPKQIDKYATHLQKALVALDDTYEAAGIEGVRTSLPTVVDDIANYEACGRFDKAFTCCTTALYSKLDQNHKEFLIENSLKCLSNQGDYQRLYESSKNLIEEYSQYRRSILPYNIEATWKLNRWEELERSINRNEQLDAMLEHSSVSQAYLLISSLNGAKDMDERSILVRKKMIKPLSIAIMDKSAYFRGYQSLIMLHSIGDFVLFEDSMNKFACEPLNDISLDTMRTSILKQLNNLNSLWSKRRKLVEPSFKTLEPLMMWQRSISTLIAQKYPIVKGDIGVDIGRLWLSSAESAREAKIFDRSFYGLTQAQKWFGAEFSQLSLDLRVNYHIEQARLDWDQGEKTKAIRGLKLSIEKLKNHPLYKHLDERRRSNATLSATNDQNSDSFPSLTDVKTCQVCEKIDIDERESFARLKMLLTQYSEDAAAGIPETLFFMYEECVHLGVNKEETYFQLARYYDKMLTYYMDNPKLCNEPPADPKDKHFQDATQRFSQTLRSGDKEEVYTKLMEHSIIAFGNSLKYGVKYLRESMPRLLNIWYDLGSRKTKSTQTRSVSSRIENTIRFIDDLKKSLPAYYFMTATSLILSRICHTHSGVSKKTCEIIELLLAQYPHQLSWLLLAVMNDKDNEDRKKAARLAFANARKRDPKVFKILTDTFEFSRVIQDMVFKFTEKDHGKYKKKVLAGTFDLASISKIATGFDFAKHKVIIPTQKSMRAILPIDINSSFNDNDVYPNNSALHIQSILPKVRIYNSLQKPKGVTFRCANGESFSLLLKYGDDLRKDSRCTEFLDLLNKILRRNSQSNARFVEIKTFLVLPVDSECGIIEMIPNCEPVRGLVEKLYKERRNDFTLTYVECKKARNIQDKHEHYLNILKLMKPCVLPTWFLRNFPEPTSWYMARLAFTRSTAVISMGGYIIGLGDRHLDNILLDTCTGSIVHVDFNLLFHQAESLPTPERVPFRLTHNIVAAFGAVGCEGNFRKVCEMTMSVMRKEKDALLTTLKPFLSDPCSEWVKVRELRNIRTNQDPDERHSDNKDAKFKLDVIERKLRGFPRSHSFKPLKFIDSYSVEAQVDNLIEEASDTLNLSLMYHGWCPHV